MEQFEKATPFEINAQFQFASMSVTIESVSETLMKVVEILTHLSPGESVTVRRPSLDEMTDRQEFAAEMDRAELKEKRVPYE